MKEQSYFIKCTYCDTQVERPREMKVATCIRCRAEQKREYARQHPNKVIPTDNSMFWEEAEKRANNKTRPSAS